MSDKKPRGPARPEPFRPHHNVDTLRVPPQSVEAEQAVIGGLMIRPDALGRVSSVIGEADFYRRDHRLIFRGMVELIEKKKPVDSVTLGEWFEANCLSEQIGGPSYLIELHSTTPSAANIMAYAEIVREKSLQRKLIEYGTKLVNDGFQPEGKEPHELLSDARIGIGELAAGAHRLELMRPADLGSLMGQQLRAPRFVVDPYLPRGVVTLLGSHGGAGKTTLAETISAHVAAGRFVFGRCVEQGKVSMFSLEDDAAKVAYKTRRICDAYNLDEDLVRANLRVFDWSKGDTALATEIGDQGVRRLQATALFDHLRTASAGASLIVVDNTSDAFDADETNRRQVAAFMRLFRNLAEELDAAVLLLAHIDKNAARYGAGNNSYSGSTAWHNSARSRLALIDDKDAIELRQEKLNAGKPAEPFRLRWADHGVLVPIGDGSGMGEPSSAAGNDEQAVMHAVRAATVAGIHIPTGRTGSNTTHHVLGTFNELPARLKGKRGAEAFWAALGRLQSAGRLQRYDVTDRHRNKRTCLAEAGVQIVGSVLDLRVSPPPTPPVVGTDELTQGRSSVHVSGIEAGSNATNATNAKAGGVDFRRLQSGDD